MLRQVARGWLTGWTAPFYLVCVARWERGGLGRAESGSGPPHLGLGTIMGVAGDSRLERKSRGNGTSAAERDGQAVWRGFVNRDLTAGEKEQFEDWLTTDEAWDTMAAVVGSGAHLSVKVNPNGGGFLATCTQRNPAHVNAGLCVSARSSEAGKAFFRLLYTVHILGVEAAWADSGKVADPDRW